MIIDRRSSDGNQSVKILNYLGQKLYGNYNYKVYDIELELAGKYNQYKFHESMKNLKLPDGSPEDYKSYEILVSKK